MAFIVRRPGGRWEIRESFQTPRGPRSRTLATFRELSGEVIERAARAARTDLDRETLIRTARREGVPFEPARVDRAAAELLREVSRGGRLRRGLQRLIAERFGGSREHALDDSFTEWLGASAEERARALVELLDLADSLPSRREGPLRFPRFSPAGEG